MVGSKWLNLTLNIHDRFTSSRTLTCYFLLVTLHSLAQMLFQFAILSKNLDSSHILIHIGNFSTQADVAFVCDPESGRCFGDSAAVAIPPVWDFEAARATLATTVPAVFNEVVSSSLVGGSLVVIGSVTSSIASLPSTTSQLSSAVQTRARSTTSLASIAPSAFDATPPSTSIISSSTSPPSRSRTSPAATFTSSPSNPITTTSLAPVVAAELGPSPSSAVTVRARPASTSASRPPSDSYRDDRDLGKDYYEHDYEGDERKEGSEEGEGADAEEKEDEDEEDLSRRDSSTRRSWRSVLTKRGAVTLMPQDGTTSLVVSGLFDASGDVTIDQRCVGALRVLGQGFQDRIREDILLGLYMFFVASLSIVAMLNESIPHVLAALFAQVFSLGWSIFQAVHTERAHQVYHDVSEYYCSNVAVLHDSVWIVMRGLEATSIVLNFLALLASAYLSWRLLEAFGWATFRQLGANAAVNRAYRLVLAFSIFLQLDLFFLISWSALWLNQICTGPIFVIIRHGTIYKTIFAILVLASLPFVTLAWIASRREWRVGMDVFLGSSVVIIVIWISMFASRAFTTLIRTWSFFAFLGGLTAALIITTVALGVAVRVSFGSGLQEYLSNMRSLSSLDTLEEHSVESDEKDAYRASIDNSFDMLVPHRPAAVPTFSTAFPSGPAPPPSRMFTSRFLPFVRRFSNPPPTSSGRPLSPDLQPPPPALHLGPGSRESITSFAPSWSAGDDTRPLPTRTTARQSLAQRAIAAARAKRETAPGPLRPFGLPPVKFVQDPPLRGTGLPSRLGASQEARADSEGEDGRVARWLANVGLSKN